MMLCPNGAVARRDKRTSLNKGCDGGGTTPEAGEPGLLTESWKTLKYGL
jgi:hypothetical protein